MKKLPAWDRLTKKQKEEYEDGLRLGWSFSDISPFVSDFCLLGIRDAENLSRPNPFVFDAKTVYESRHV